MSHNFPARGLRALVFLDVESPKTIDYLIKWMPKALQEYPGLHSFNLLAESFIAYSLTNSKSQSDGEREFCRNVLSHALYGIFFFLVFEEVHCSFAVSFGGIQYVLLLFLFV